MIQQKAKQLPTFHRGIIHRIKPCAFLLDGVFLLGVGYGGHYVTTNWLSAWNEDKQKDKIPAPDRSNNASTGADNGSNSPVGSTPIIEGCFTVTPSPSSTEGGAPGEAKPSSLESGSHPAAGRERVNPTPVKPAPREATPSRPVVIKDKEGIH